MKKIIVEMYETSNGFRFYTEKEAIEYEAFIEFAQWYDSNVHNEISDATPGEAFDWICNNKYVLFHILKQLVNINDESH